MNLPNKPVLFIFFLVISVIFFHSCVKDTYDMEKLSTQVSFNQRIQGKKLAYGKISFEDIIAQEDTLVEVNDDGTMQVMITEDSIFTVDFADQFDEFTQGGLPAFGIDTILDFEIDDKSISDSVSMDEMMESFNPVVAQNIRDAKNNPIPGVGVRFPGTGTKQEGGSYSAGDFEGFDWVELSDGEMEVIVTNNLVSRIDSFVIEIYDSTEAGNKLITQFVFQGPDSIPSGETASQSYSLAGERIHSNIIFDIKSIYIPPKNSDFELEDNVKITFSVKNLVVDRAKAEIEGIESSSKSQRTSFDKFEGITVENLIIENGFINYSINNPFPEELTVNLSFPDMRRLSTNEKWSQELVVKPDENLNSSWDLSNTITRIDPDDPGLSYSYSFKVDSSEQPVIFDNNVEFSGNFEVSEIDFAVEGYFGDTTITLDPVELDLPGMPGLPGLGESKIELAFASIRLNYMNSIGMPLEFNLDLKGVEEDGTVRKLKMDPGEELLFKSPGIDTTITDLAQRYGPPVNSTMEISGENSNLPSLLAIPLPESISFAGNAKANPAGDTVNFLRKTSSMTVGYEVEVPIAIRSDSIVIDSLYRHTLSDNFPEGVEVGDNAELLLSFRFVNDLPFNVSILISPYDSVADFTYDPILDDVFVRASTVNAAGVTIEPSEYEVEAGITGEGLDNLLNSTHMKARIKIDTKEDPDDPGSETKNAALKTTYAVSFEVDVKTALDIRYKLPIDNE